MAASFNEFFLDKIWYQKKINIYKNVNFCTRENFLG